MLECVNKNKVFIVTERTVQNVVYFRMHIDVSKEGL